MLSDADLAVLLFRLAVDQFEADISLLEAQLHKVGTSPLQLKDGLVAMATVEPMLSLFLS